MKMKLKDLGEIDFIKRISKKIRVDNSVIKGIGDDAAVIRWDKDSVMLFASDMIIEGVHFDCKRSTPFQIGRKALCINISDIAAMGGVPLYVTVSIGLPEDLDIGFVDRLSSGIILTARDFGVNIVGGDTNTSKKIVIDIAMIGRANKHELVHRRGAKPGDVILVTGKLGGSIKERHLTFIPRLAESRFLVKNFKITSMIDVSDGLSLDLFRICEASKVGARVYESLVPLSKDAASIEGALSDGEDFELLFTASKRDLKDIMGKFKKRFNTPISAIGEVLKKPMGIKMVSRNGKVTSLRKRGFSHF